MNDTLKSYLIANLKNCCEELLEWQLTGILCDGCVRQAARFSPFVKDVHNLRYIQNCVTDLALHYVKNNHTP